MSDPLTPEQLQAIRERLDLAEEPKLTLADLQNMNPYNTCRTWYITDVGALLAELDRRDALPPDPDSINPETRLPYNFESKYHTACKLGYGGDYKAQVREQINDERITDER